jgi:hypothetical protein
MSSFRKRGDKWQARVHRKEHKPVVQSFNSKADAIKWARNVESQLDLGILAPKQTMPRLMPMMERYFEEVTPTKKGESRERYRAAQWKKTKLAEMPPFLQQVDAFGVNSVKQNQNAPKNSAEHQPQKTRPNADFMVEHQQAPEQSNANNAAPRSRPTTAEKHAKRGPYVHWLHVDCVT